MRSFRLCIRLETTKAGTHLVVAELQQDVDVGAVLKHVLKVYDVHVLQRAVDLDLTQELGALPALGERLLRDDFRRPDLLGLEVRADVALGEAALSQVLSSLVLLYLRGLSPDVGDLLLEDQLLLRFRAPAVVGVVLLVLAHYILPILIFKCR